MRAQDWREVSAVLGDIPRTHAAIMMLESSLRDGERTAWQVEVRGEPVIIAGLSFPFPHIACAWSYGTDRMVRGIPALSHWSTMEWPGLCERLGVRRIEVRTIHDHDLSHRWLNGRGAVFEGAMPDYGLNGEMFHLYAWTRTNEAAWFGNIPAASRRVNAR